MTTGRVLVVDPDPVVQAELRRAVERFGHTVATATDGRTGLQSAVETPPDVILVDRDIKVFDIRTFLDVLRDNPRTNRAAVLVLGLGDLAHHAAIDGRAEPLVKPFHPQQVAARVDRIIRRVHAPVQEADLRGDLSQVALWDLLQVFGTSQRTGRLRIEAEGAAGDLWVRDGRVVDATQGHASGEKAFYRVLGFSRGAFHFVPGLTRAEPRLLGSTEMLLMEAARRLDETKRLREALPDFSTTVTMSGFSTIPPGIASEIALVLDEPRAIEELLDVLPHHDLEILQVIAGMLEAKVLVVEESHAKLSFCDADELPALRAAALRLRRGGAHGPARVGVVSPRATEISRLARALGRVRDFLPSAEPPVTFDDQLLGSLGTLTVGGTPVELVALPHRECFRPLWGASLVASTTLVFLGSPSEASRLAADVRELDLRIVRSESGHERPSGAISVLRDALGVSGGRAYAAPR